MCDIVHYATLDNTNSKLQILVLLAESGDFASVSCSNSTLNGVVLAAASSWQSAILNAGCVLPAHILPQIVTKIRKQRGLCDGAIYRELLKSFTTMEAVGWHKIVWGTEKVPTARKYHTLTAFGDYSGRACLFGGHCVSGSQRDRLLNDVWILHVSPFKAQARWQRVLTGDGPSPPRRCHHHAVISRNRILIVHGGLLEQG